MSVPSPLLLSSLLLLSLVSPLFNKHQARQAWARSRSCPPPLGWPSGASIPRQIQQAPARRAAPPSSRHKSPRRPAESGIGFCVNPVVTLGFSPGRSDSCADCQRCRLLAFRGRDSCRRQSWQRHHCLCCETTADYPWVLRSFRSWVPPKTPPGWLRVIIPGGRLARGEPLDHTWRRHGVSMDRSATPSSQHMRGTGSLGAPASPHWQPDRTGRYRTGRGGPNRCVRSMIDFVRLVIGV